MRALAIASVAAVVGAVVCVVSTARDLPVGIAAAGAVVVVLAVALAVAASIAARRLSSTVLLDEEALTIIRPGERTVLRWTDVAEVKLIGRRLVLLDRSGSSLSLLDPPGSSGGAFRETVAAIGRRLDTYA